MLQRLSVARPVESRAGVGLALRGNVAVTLNAAQVDGRPGTADVPGKLLQHRVLRIGIRQVVGAFQFDADGEIVTAFTPVEARHTGVPGAVEQRHELGHRTVTLDEQVRRHGQVADAGEVRVFVGVQAVLEELLDLAGTETGRRQADVVDHQQGNRFAFGAGIEVRRGAVGDSDSVEPASGTVQLHGADPENAVNRSTVCPVANGVCM